MFPSPSAATTVAAGTSPNRTPPSIRAVASRCRRVLDAYENAGSYDFETYGERLVVEALRDQDVRMVFDVGANRGDWASMMLGVHTIGNLLDRGLFCFAAGKVGRLLDVGAISE